MLVLQVKENRKELDVLENNLEKTGQFYIKVRVGYSEIEVSAPDKDFVLQESNRLIGQFKLDTTASYPPEMEASQGNGASLTRQGMDQNRNEKPQTLGEFFRQFKLQTNLDKMLVLGYWCEVIQKQSSFTLEDIVAKYKEIKEPAPTNMRRDLNSLVSKGLFLFDDKAEQTYALTNTGINEVKSKMTQTKA